MGFPRKTARPEQSRAPSRSPGTPPPSGQVDKRAEAREGDSHVFCPKPTLAVVFPISCGLGYPVLV